MRTTQQIHLGAGAFRNLPKREGSGLLLKALLCVLVAAIPSASVSARMLYIGWLPGSRQRGEQGVRPVTDAANIPNRRRRGVRRDRRRRHRRHGPARPPLGRAS